MNAANQRRRPVRLGFALMVTALMVFGRPIQGFAEDNVQSCRSKCDMKCGQNRDKYDMEQVRNCHIKCERWR